MRAPARLVALFVGATLLALVTTFGASAGHGEVRDTNDTRGRLDVRSVVMDGTTRPTWTVVTWGSWSATDIWDAGFVTINLDTFGTPRADYYILVGSVGTHMFGELWRDRATKRDYRVSGVKVRRPSRTSLSATIPLGLMRIGERRVAYTWYVETLFTGDRCRQVCFDLVPDQGVVAEPLPGATPTVTPTPDPTGTPTPTPDPTGTPSPTPSGSPAL